MLTDEPSTTLVLLIMIFGAPSSSIIVMLALEFVAVTFSKFVILISKTSLASSLSSWVIAKVCDTEVEPAGIFNVVFTGVKSSVEAVSTSVWTVNEISFADTSDKVKLISKLPIASFTSIPEKLMLGASSLSKILKL